ncbi:MAG TPA: hypothetical protein VGF53_15500 [Pseudolabrys sp.]|jgi:hypothetical protein
MRGIRFRCVRPIWVIALLALAALAQGWQPACAQNVGGRIEVRCAGYHYCAVYQDGKPAHPNADYQGDWHQVSYVEMAAPAKP